MKKEGSPVTQYGRYEQVPTLGVVQVLKKASKSH